MSLLGELPQLARPKAVEALYLALRYVSHGRRESDETSKIDAIFPESLAHAIKIIRIIERDSRTPANKLTQEQRNLYSKILREEILTTTVSRRSDKNVEALLSRLRNYTKEGRSAYLKGGTKNKANSSH